MRAVVLTGAGSAFCAGADINEFRASLHGRVPDVYEDGRLVGALVSAGRRVREAPHRRGQRRRPWAAASGLVALCHFARGRGNGACLGATELRIGMFPMVIFPALARAVGERRALELSLTARMFGAAEAGAHRAWCSGSCPPRSWTGPWASWPERMAGWSPVAVRLGLRGVRTTRGLPAPDAYEQLHALRQVLQQTEDLHEGTTAFFEKRTPKWTGR